MSIKEELNLALEALDEAELRQVAEYIAFLKFRRKTTKENRFISEERTDNSRQPQKELSEA
jgi:hypothetical protein